jgi:hypothetical protein
MFGSGVTRLKKTLMSSSSAHCIGLSLEFWKMSIPAANPGCDCHTVLKSSLISPTPQPRQVNISQANSQPLQWACPNANYLDQIIELDPNMQFFWLVPTKCAAQKKISTLPDFESNFGPKISPDDFFTVTETLDFLTTQKP